MKVILKKDFLIGSRMIPKRTLIEVTNNYGRQLISEGVAREENGMENLIKSFKKGKK